MAALKSERVEDTLWILGNVDRSMESELEEVLDSFGKIVPPDKQTVDMSNVNYFASSSAKVLIGYGQEVEAKGSKLKVLSSMPVVQTLNLLGAKTWLDIQPCQKPNPRPTPGAAPARKQVSATGIAPATKGATSSYLKPSAANVVSASAAPPPTTGIGRPPSVPMAAPSLGTQTSADNAANLAQERAGAQLIEDETELPDEHGVLRELIVMGTYTFHFHGNQTDITGKVLDHINGPWILVDTRGARRMINISQVTSIDIL